ncbi:papilin-like [Haliotis rufescens]|uniref:papilin-like n=1 Tax=Haliotis rufescens TaxID=6454 RepID=UPI00201F0E77|nr:papilin-like [Haliotis rufescens]XP_048238535.1 papilin-like [Haliotis rufescens]
MFPLSLYLLMAVTPRLATAQLTFPEEMLKDNLTPYSCRLSPVTGPCQSQMRRYFYNITSGQCQPFSYSGCRGNDNNFHTLKQCVGSCICAQPAIGKPCSSNNVMRLQRIYFDSKSGQCKQLAYGTCQENSNVYPSLHHCQQTCSLCHLIKDSGPCRGSYRRFYFDTTHNRCVEFFYGGCGGNGNNFIRKAECVKTCSQKRNISIRIVKNGQMQKLSEPFLNMLRLRYPNKSSIIGPISKPVASVQLPKTLSLRPGGFQIPFVSSHTNNQTSNNGKHLTLQNIPRGVDKPKRHLRVFMEHAPKVTHHKEVTNSAEEAGITEEPPENEARKTYPSSTTPPPRSTPRKILFRLRFGTTNKEKLKFTTTTNLPIQGKGIKPNEQATPAFSVLEVSNTSEKRQVLNKSLLGPSWTVRGGRRSAMARDKQPYLSGYINNPIGWTVTGKPTTTTPIQLTTSPVSTGSSHASRTRATLNGQSAELPASVTNMSSLTTSTAVKFILNLISTPYSLMNHNHGMA